MEAILPCCPFPVNRLLPGRRHLLRQAGVRRPGIWGPVESDQPAPYTDRRLAFLPGSTAPPSAGRKERLMPTRVRCPKCQTQFALNTTPGGPNSCPGCGARVAVRPSAPKPTPPPPEEEPRATESEPSPPPEKKRKKRKKKAK